MGVLRKLCWLGASGAAITAILLAAAVAYIMLIPVNIPLHKFDQNEDYSDLDKSLLPLLSEVCCILRRLAFWPFLRWTFRGRHQ
jgi:hypothetical protein